MSIDPLKQGFTPTFSKPATGALRSCRYKRVDFGQGHGLVWLIFYSLGVRTILKGKGVEAASWSERGVSSIGE